MHRANLRPLRVLLVLLAERSVSRAAERLGISQPAASHALARLRALYQDPLLLRSRSGMIPTPRAMELEKSARRLFEEYEALTKPAAAFDPSVSARTFVLTAPEYAEHVLMAPLLRHLRAAAPNIRIEVHPPEPARSLELLERGEVDLRIAWLPKPLPSLRSMQLFQDRMVCIADRGHPRIRGSLTLEQFFTLPHVRTSVGMSRTTTGRVIDEAVQRHGRKLDRFFLLQNFLTVPHALVGTDAIATLPRTLAVAFAAQHPLQVLEPPLKLPRIRYAAYWHERNQRDEAHKWLRAAVLRAASSVESASVAATK